MAYVVTEPCVSVKDHACVNVCPVDCIYEYEGAEHLLIHPEECIDCGACVPECPVDAIFPASDVPLQWRTYIAKNAEPFHTSGGLPKALLREKWEHQRAQEQSSAQRYYRKYGKA